MGFKWSDIHHVDQPGIYTLPDGKLIQIDAKHIVQWTEDEVVSGVGANLAPSFREVRFGEICPDLRGPLDELTVRQLR